MLTIFSRALNFFQMIFTKNVRSTSIRLRILDKSFRFLNYMYKKNNTVLKNCYYETKPNWKLKRIFRSPLSCPPSASSCCICHRVTSDRSPQSPPGSQVLKTYTLAGGGIVQINFTFCKVNAFQVYDFYLYRSCVRVRCWFFFI